MRRGTTPTLTFTTPYAADLVESGYITFNQRGNTRKIHAFKKYTNCLQNLNTSYCCNLLLLNYLDNYKKIKSLSPVDASDSFNNAERL